jgi:hypothetical protein
VFRVALDQAGHVDFVGRNGTARPGVFSKQVSADAALSVYDQLLRSAYFRARTRYVDAGDGCVTIADQRTGVWDVTVEGRERKLTRYYGCQGIAELSSIDAIEAVLVAAAGVGEWIECSHDCPAPGSALSPKSSYRVAVHDDPIGVLAIDNTSPATVTTGTWVLTGCDGTTLGGGKSAAEGDRWVFVNAADEAIALPAGRGEFGSIVFDQQGASGFRARGLTDDESDDVTLTVTPTTSC